MKLSAEKQAEIEAARAQSEPTRRATVPAMEELLYKPLQVLDHGFIRVVDYMGDDRAIVQSARVSYGEGTKKVSSDKGLINYLMRHRHTSPFEMCEIKLHVKLPIFIARQWIRHRTANVNEYSARYSILSREFYIPDHDYLVAGREAQKLKKKEEKTGQSAFLELFESAPQAVAEQSTSNKQGREAAMSADEAFKPTDRIKRESARSFTAYEYLLNEDPEGNARDENRPGIARELARMVLPLNTYTEWYWKIDLHNLLHFIALRADHHAQYEIRAYADVLLDVVRSWVPHTAAAFENYRMTGTSLSGKALEAVKRMVKGESVAASDVGMSAGEWREFEKLLEIEK
jgi:thymidylate synthase (FAD)